MKRIDTSKERKSGGFLGFDFKKIAGFIRDKKIIALPIAGVLTAAVVLLIVFSGGGNARESIAQASPAQDFAISGAIDELTPEPSESHVVSPPSASVQETPAVSAGPGEEASPPEETETPKPSGDDEEKPAPKPSEKPTKKTTKATDWKKIYAEFEVKGKYYNDTHFSSNHYAYTDQELKMLATVIYLEAKNQPYGCKVAVGNVVMNRVLASGYPGETIQAVVTRKNQFCYSTTTQPNAECFGVARDILDYEVWTVPQNTYFFRANKSTSNWGSHEYFKHYGNTAFYQDSYRGRYNGSAIPARLYERIYRWPQYGCQPGSRVKKIQKMLRSLGYKVSTDGYFGVDTKEALQKFQKSKGLKADGVAGQSTIKALIKKYGIDKYNKL